MNTKDKIIFEQINSGVPIIQSMLETLYVNSKNSFISNEVSDDIYELILGIKSFGIKSCEIRDEILERELEGEIFQGDFKYRPNRARLLYKNYINLLFMKRRLNKCLEWPPGYEKVKEALYDFEDGLSNFLSHFRNKNPDIASGDFDEN